MYASSSRVVDTYIPSVTRKNVVTGSINPSPYQYLAVIGIWILAMFWFEPRLIQLMDMATGFWSASALAFFIVFVNIAWLYGFYNIGVIVFALIYRRWFRTGIHPRVEISGHEPEVAILYTTCNDFVEESAVSCVRQNYPNYRVYILDDSTDANCKKRIDLFAARHPELVRVVRRPKREGFKAGNLNYALAHVAKQRYFAIADADEILPANFLTELVPVLEADPNCGFVQANHHSNPKARTGLAKALGVGIDIHWKWYQPLRNRFGFVMFLGHGAILRRRCWEVVGGFPEIVSEDLAYAIRLREHGWRGRFVEEVTCYESFPETVRAFRIRHMKWTRGTCEFLRHEFSRLILSKKITWPEKFDILFPTLNLPLTLFYFLFMIDANLVFPAMFGTARPMTFVSENSEFILSSYTLSDGFAVVYSLDFLLITLMTFFAPVLCFVIEMAHRPLYLFRFLCHSTALYAALSPLSALGVLSYTVSGKATFLVTGDREAVILQNAVGASASLGLRLKQGVKTFFSYTHPDQRAVQAFEFLTGLIIAVSCLFTMQVSLLGLAFAFSLMPIMHKKSWENPIVKGLVYFPFLLILTGVFGHLASMVGIQTMFFGFGFHF